MSNRRTKSEFATEYTVMNGIKKGDIFTKLSMFIMGTGNLARQQIVKGIIFLILEISYLYYMIMFGFNSLAMMPSLGTATQEKVFNETKQVYEYIHGDNSMLILLYGVITAFITMAFLLVWRANIKSAYESQCLKQAGKHLPTIGEDIIDYFDKRLHKLLLFFPTLGIVIFTIMPLVFMILMAFTNYDRDHQPPGKLFDWVGFDNFKAVLDMNGSLGNTFWKVLGWTLIWAVFATFLNYILGMILAIVINRKDTHWKGFWRFCFILSIAVPQFVSLLVLKAMLQPDAGINLLLRNLGFLEATQNLPFLTNVMWARVTVIVVNLWVGIPYTLLTTTGILQNIPKELFEAAKVDGANAVRTFFKITLPYMLFVTAPTLITAFIGNINNFNVIFLLTGGDPASMSYYNGTAGKTDLLVTWLYKLTINFKDYNLGAVIGILTFILCAGGSLFVYRRTGAYKNEEGFQ